MRTKAVTLILIATILITACLPSDKKETTAASSVEVSNESMQATLDQALADPKAFQTSLKETCPRFKPLLLETAETINMGSRIWNAGGLPITIRLYEGVAYRVLYEVKDECTDLSHAFQAGLTRAQQQTSANERGRVLRNTLDLIMGGAPSKPPGAQ